MGIHHKRTLNIRHFHQRKKNNISSHCNKCHNIVSQKQYVSFFIKTKLYTMYHISNRFLCYCFISLNSEDEKTAPRCVLLALISLPLNYPRRQGIGIFPSSLYDNSFCFFDFRVHGSTCFNFKFWCYFV